MIKKRHLPTPLVWEEERKALPEFELPPPTARRTLSSFWRLVKFLWLLKRTQRLPLLERARRAREYIEQQGGIWVKMGQLMASRADIVPTEFITELEKLFDHAGCFPGDQARQVVEESLGKPIEKVFSEFETQALAAASIGQVHKARLRREGAWVVVKVRRPFVEAAFERDLALVRFLVKVLIGLGLLAHWRLEDMAAELELVVKEELDYRIEANTGRQMRKILRHHRRVEAPKIYKHYCAERVLVMEFVAGVLMSDVLKMRVRDPLRFQNWLHENQIKVKKVASALTTSLYRQVYEEKLFHADMHPGNIMLLKKGRIVLLDFGSAGVLDRGKMDLYLQYSEFLTTGQHTRAAIKLVQMASPIRRLDRDALIRDLSRAFRQAEVVTAATGIPYLERMKAQNKAAEIMGQYKVAGNWELLKMMRTMLVIETSVRDLAPDTDWNKLTARYLKEHAQRQEQRRANRFWIDMRDLAERGAEAVERLNKASLSDFREGLIRLESRVATFFTDVLKSTQRILGLALLLVVLVYLWQHQSWLVPSRLETWVASSETTLPRFPQLGWIAAGVGLFFLRRLVMELRRHFTV